MFGPNSRRALILAGGGASTRRRVKQGRNRRTQITFDAEAALADHEAMDVILQSDAMAGFRALGAGISFQGVAPEMEFAVRRSGASSDSGEPSPTAEALAGEIFSAASDSGAWPLQQPHHLCVPAGKDLRLRSRTWAVTSSMMIWRGPGHRCPVYPLSTRDRTENPIRRTRWATRISSTKETGA